MKICAVICEYNPFHNGHAYHLEQARKKSGCDALICVMSGNFVQRAEPAIVDKYFRAGCALKNGADMVIEMPAVYSTSSGERFASGAMGIITALSGISFLAAGCEDEEADALKVLANIQAEESEDFKRILSEQLQSGKSYPASYSYATAYLAQKENIPASMSDILLSKPNNLLFLEYLKAIKRQNSPIIPLFIKRQGSDYNDTNLSAGGFASATAIRKKLAENKTAEISAHVPQNTYSDLISRIKQHPVRNDIYEAIVINTLRTTDAATLSNLLDCREGIENLLKKNAEDYVTLPEILENTKSKRYTLSRLKRICLQSVLGITKDVFAKPLPTLGRVLAVKESFKPYLATLPEGIYVKTSDIEETEDETIKQLLEIEKRASGLYSLITKVSGNRFYSSKLVTVD